MHTISIRDVGLPSTPETTYLAGLAAEIVPPVNLEQKAAEAYIRNGSFIEDERSRDEGFMEVMLIGSGPHTAIFASVLLYENPPTDNEPLELARTLLYDRTAQLLGYLGLEAERG